MFQKLDGVELGLDMLKLYKKVFDIQGRNTGGPLDYESELDCGFYAIQNVSEKVIFYCLEDFPENCMYKITFDEMPEFFRLCKLYARNHGISFKNTKYFVNLVEFIADRFSENWARGLAWNLVAPKKICKKKTYHLYVETCGEYYYGFSRLAIALYDIDEYIKIMADELLGVVATESKVIHFGKQKQIGKKGHSCKKN